MPPASTVAAFDVSVGRGRVTLAAPEYCGPGATVLWARTHSTVAGTHSTLGLPASRVKGVPPVRGPQAAFAARKLHVRRVCAIGVPLRSTLVEFGASVGRLWVAPGVPFI